MTPPQSPGREGEAVDNLARDITARHGINLPIRGTTWSPSKTRSLRGPGDEILNRLRYLFYADKERLQRVLDDFDKKAEEIRTEWKCKPRAESNVIPRQKMCNSLISPQWMGTHSAPTQAVVDQLTTTLTHLLNESADLVKSSKRAGGLDHGMRSSYGSPSDTNSLKDKALTNLPEHLPALLKSGNIHHEIQYRGLPTTRTRRRLFTRNKSLSEPLMKSVSELSSDDYPCDVEELMGQVPTQDFANERNSQTTDVLSFQQRPISDETELDKQLQAEMSPIAGVSSSRKRSFPGLDESPRKISGNGSARDITNQSIHRSPSGNLSALAKIPGNISSDTSLPSRTADTISRSLDASKAMYNLIGAVNPSSSKSTSLNSSFTTSFGSSTNPTEYVSQDVDRSDYSTQVNIPKTSLLRSDTTESFGEAAKRVQELELGVADAVVNPEEPIGIVVEQNIDKPAPMGQSDTGNALLKSRLHDLSPFASFQCIDQMKTLPFQHVYETIRASQESGVPLREFHSMFKNPDDEYDAFWSKLSAVIKQHKAIVPERSHAAAWCKARSGFNEVTLGGKMTFTGSKDGPLLQFKLNPLRKERSYRIARKFGSDRFLILSFPIIRRKDLPNELKKDFVDTRLRILQWLVREPHSLLGRTWRAFLVKPSEQSKKARLKKSADAKDAGFRVFMFATDGENFHDLGHVGEVDFRKHKHKAMSVQTLLDWFMPVEKNRDEPALKLFSRLNLAVSGTYPTIKFDPLEIIRTSDSYNTNPHQRHLEEDRRTSRLPLGTAHGEIMNDGCARISEAAAREVARCCGLDYVPSAFQGRIGPAKGVWMGDASGEQLCSSKRNFWIEITDQQSKFESHACDIYLPDAARVTFEVNDYAKKLVPASLNFQLLPILAHRGVPFHVLSRLLEEDLTRKLEDLEQAMDSPVTLQKWVQDTRPTTSERLASKGILMRGGLPSSLSEIIVFLLEQGFTPHASAFLKDRVYEVLEAYCLRLENHMNIGVGRSTYALMIADPLAILNEGEVHFGFSTMFTDPISGWSDSMLHDIDVLVARSPALLPSDIQKVHAIFHPRLRMYRDVIVFSSKGPCPLAEKLSGGDYDGDKAWVCWDCDLVRPFTNFVNPGSPKNLPDMLKDEDLGIIAEKTRVSDMLQTNDFTNVFLEHGFDFTFQNNMLGISSAYHEALCYHGVSIDDPNAVALAHLRGRLVDRAKAGIVFDEAQWKNFLSERKLPQTLTKPAYKNPNKARPTTYFVDQLVFEVAKGVRERTLHRYTERFKDVGTWDTDLARVWKFELAEGRSDPGYMRILDLLMDDLRRIFNEWNSVIASFEDDDDEEVWNKRPKKGQLSSFTHCLERSRQDFLDVQPRPPPLSDCALTARWKREQNKLGNGLACYWELLKASALFFQFSKKKFVWYVAGLELGILKATANGRGSYRHVTRGIHEAYKIDSRMAKHTTLDDDIDDAPTFDGDLFDEEEIDWDEVQGFCD